MRILVVEDNPINQQVARDLLKREGAEVTLAEHGQQALDLLRQHPDGWDVVLMDMQMPVMDGLQATQAIRHQLGLQSLPIVAMTANAMASDREACLAAGMNDHVGKPFAIDQLVRVLLHWAPNAVRPETAAAEAAAEPPSARPPSVQAALTAPWPEAERVDVPAALARLGDDPALYARIVRGFVQGLVHTQAQLQAQLDAGADERLAALLHTLKGTAGTVGAVRLAERAAEAERAVKAQLGDPAAARAPLPPWWPALAEELECSEQALRRVLAELQARGLVEAPPEEAGPQAAADADPARWRETLQRLQDLLAASDMEALEVHDALLAEPAVAQDARWAELHRAMEAMDFDAAQAAVRHLLQGGLERGDAG